ncbi:MAG: NosD domain-containing protein, partial [Candidatus Hodarchaeales archaeon]
TATIRHGIFLDPSDHNVISDNLISDNTGNGIDLEDSDNTTISDNTVINNDGYGVDLDGSSDENSVTGNDFVGNNINGMSQASDNGLLNSFAFNYLIDHDNRDGDNNGVSDKSYEIDGASGSSDDTPYS